MCSYMSRIEPSNGSPTGNRNSFRLKVTVVWFISGAIEGAESSLVCLNLSRLQLVLELHKLSRIQVYHKQHCDVIEIYVFYPFASGAVNCKVDLFTIATRPKPAAVIWDV